ncbi:DUF3304 domain-containing protein [Pseudomonas atacamensis]|jgi:hypothetical protein|uniref:DUF3304 domain-containing protein n=1 Tax=Pseudomonas atacamensis TaxID=2565368 RepID=UPI001CBA9872|nr:DUF3304 domain-containing protein [Pseudomonas atacamensis]
MRLIDIAADARRKRTWRRRRIAVALLALLISYATPKIINLFRTPGAMLTSENYTDRPIFSYWVNDFWGGNLFAMGGGGIMCCSKFEGDTAKVTWILDITQQQQIQGSVEERHELQLSLPQRGPHDQYLHVRFDPGYKVRLGWSPDLFSPFEPRPTKTVSGSIEAQ